jgi:hypothetical protein
MKEVDAIEYYSIVLYVIIYGFAEVNGVLRPVHGLLFMVADVVAVVPALYIIVSINAGNAILIVITGIGRVYERMLRPVAHHGHKSVKEEGKHEYPKCGLKADKAHNDTEQHKQHLSTHRAVKQALALLPEKIGGEVIDTSKQEGAEVNHKVLKRVSLKGHGAAFIVLQVILRMVHADVMGVVCLRGMTEKGGYDPGEVIIQEFILLFKESTVTGTVEHKAERALVGKIVEPEVSNSDSPPCPALEERHVKQNAQGKEGKADAHSEVGERKIALIPDEPEEELIQGRILLWLHEDRVCYLGKLFHRKASVRMPCKVLNKWANKNS